MNEDGFRVDLLQSPSLLPSMELLVGLPTHPLYPVSSLQEVVVVLVLPLEEQQRAPLPPRKTLDLLPSETFSHSPSELPLE